MKIDLGAIAPIAGLVLFWTGFGFGYFYGGREEARRRSQIVERRRLLDKVPRRGRNFLSYGEVEHVPGCKCRPSNTLYWELSPAITDDCPIHKGQNDHVFDID